MVYVDDFWNGKIWTKICIYIERERVLNAFKCYLCFRSYFFLCIIKQRKLEHNHITLHYCHIRKQKLFQPFSEQTLCLFYPALSAALYPVSFYSILNISISSDRQLATFNLTSIHWWSFSMFLFLFNYLPSIFLYIFNFLGNCNACIFIRLKTLFQSTGIVGTMNLHICYVFLTAFDKAKGILTSWS